MTLDYLRWYAVGIPAEIVKKERHPDPIKPIDPVNVDQLAKGTKPVTKRQHLNQLVWIDSGINLKLVERFNIIGTNAWVYHAWERDDRDNQRQHSCIRYESTYPGSHLGIGSLRMGQIGCRRLPHWIDELPAMSTERINAARNFFADCASLETNIIRQVFPEVPAEYDPGRLTELYFEDGRPIVKYFSPGYKGYTEANS